MKLKSFFYAFSMNTHCIQINRDRQTERERDRETERQRDTETERQRDSETETETDTDTKTETETEPQRRFGCFSNSQNSLLPIIYF